MGHAWISPDEDKYIEALLDGWSRVGTSSRVGTPPLAQRHVTCMTFKQTKIGVLDLPGDLPLALVSVVRCKMQAPIFWHMNVEHAREMGQEGIGMVSHIYRPNFVSEVY